MFNRNAKRIAKLELQVADFEKELSELKGRYVRLQETVKSLALESLIMQLDVDERELEQVGVPKEDIGNINQMKEDYEKKLRRFIRDVVSKRRPKTKPASNGKESSKVAE